MEIGIIAEGKGDCAVLQNILMGIFPELDEEDIRFLRPDFNLDNTDKAAYANMQADEFGSWTLVKKDCLEQVKFQRFLDSPILGERYIIVQIDTAECEEKGYDVVRPDKKSEDYCTVLRELVIGKIDEWLQGTWTAQIHYAICIEEMEAWVHTLYETKDTSRSITAKETFQKIVSKKRKTDKKFDKKIKNLKTEFDLSLFLSKDFRKICSKKNINKLANNESLKTFVLSFATNKDIDEKLFA